MLRVRRPWISSRDLISYFATPRYATNFSESGSLIRYYPAHPPLSCTTRFNFQRFIQNLATPTRPKPTEKLIYGVEEDPDDLLTQEAHEVLASTTEGSRKSYPTVTYASSVTTIHSTSESQKQATFVDRTISSTLSTAAVRGPLEQINNTAMKQRSKSESPRGTWQKAQDKQFPQLKLNHVAPNFHALSSHGPIELYEYISTPLESITADKATRATNTKSRNGKKGNWLVFFSHPMDFTPVCTTEIASMAKLQGEFAKRGVKLLGLSVGSVEEHQKWMKDLRKIIESGGLRRGGPIGAAKAAAVGQPGTVQPVSSGEEGIVLPLGPTVGAGGVGALDEEKEMGMEDVVGSGSIGVAEKAEEHLPRDGKEKSLLKFPIIADEDGFVSQLYGMLEEPVDAGMVNPHTWERRSDHLRTVRSLFIIDPNRRIRVMTSYPHTTGRNTAEILRVLDALQRSDNEGIMTPEGWT